MNHVGQYPVGGNIAIVCTCVCKISKMGNIQFCKVKPKLKSFYLDSL